MQTPIANTVAITGVAMETGTYTPLLALAIRIARVFECNVEDVFRLNE
jgi:DNA-binding XRE family transcriptional regulator